MSKNPTRRFIALIIFVPLAVILIALSVANRAAVSLTLDPFSTNNPSLTYSAPLFIWLFGALALGVILGAFATWLAQGRYRKSARRSQKEAAQIREKVQALEKRDALLKQ